MWRTRTRAMRHTDRGGRPPQPRLEEVHGVVVQPGVGGQLDLGEPGTATLVAQQSHRTRGPGGPARRPGGTAGRWLTPSRAREPSLASGHHLPYLTARPDVGLADVSLVEPGHGIRGFTISSTAHTSAATNTAPHQAAPVRTRVAPKWNGRPRHQSLAGRGGTRTQGLPEDRKPNPARRQH